MKLFFIFLFILCFPFYVKGAELRSLSILTYSSSPIQYQVEIANTPQKQKLGLMYRKFLPENQGMLFLFSKPEIIHMWMKNTLIPLDMLFIDKNNQIINIFEKAQPLDETLISSIQPVLKVLELNAGEVQKNHLKIGMKIRLD